MADEVPKAGRGDAPPREAERSEVDQLADALRALVAEIAADDYRAKIGSPLTNNTAYLKAIALLELRDTLERRG